MTQTKPPICRTYAIYLRSVQFTFREPTPSAALVPLETAVQPGPQLASCTFRQDGPQPRDTALHLYTPQRKRSMTETAREAHCTEQGVQSNLSFSEQAPGELLVQEGRQDCIQYQPLELKVEATGSYSFSPEANKNQTTVSCHYQTTYRCRGLRHLTLRSYPPKAVRS